KIPSQDGDSLLARIYNLVTTVAPSNSKTIETVVLVGRPSELNRSKTRISVIIIAIKMTIKSSNEKNSGLKITFRAISIIPLEKADPINTPKEATMKMVLRDATLEPIAELRNLTASLLTPTTRSAAARINNAITNKK